MEYLIIACVIGVIPAFIASSKGRNFFLWWIYGACLFIVALIHSLVISKDMKAVAEEKKAQGYKECPFCKEYVKPGAVVCPLSRRPKKLLKQKPKQSSARRVTIEPRKAPTAALGATILYIKKDPACAGFTYTRRTI